MSEDDSVNLLTQTKTQFTKLRTPESYQRHAKVKYKKSRRGDDEGAQESAKAHLLRRLPSFQPTVRPNFGRFRNSFRKFNCFKTNEEEEIPLRDASSRHRSIDINMGLARKVSLFLFTRKTVCVHPYHPYTPEQTTRKLHFCFDDK